MFIKSTSFTKPIEWLGSISFLSVMYAIIFSIILCTVIIGVGFGGVIKVIFLSVAIIISLIKSYDTNGNGESKITKSEQDETAKSCGMFIILIMIFTEIGLFTASFKNVYTPIYTVTSDRYTIDQTSADKNKIYFKRVTFYNADTNAELGTRDSNNGEEEKLKYLTNIVGKNIYIDYIPFLRYSEEFAYVRK